ncbi:transposon ty3-g Gag-Pol polyprotein [Plakobranchus ocellatus]|uniref:Transposon ty3-g Gag-Pol polyprotein n=1 Tax=Plakobranchus ocellatus TaxID=259542 RepID=A0AAV3ZRC9_9GAST|nr:transposon ty3-g Gag-Pol polyprotein [Plakobranchus ocellatus]
MQWKGSFEIVTTVGINDYRINMRGKEKTFHANLLKAYIARDQDANQENTDERPPTSSSDIPAASVTIIEDLEGEHFNDSDCEALPELGGWGSEKTVNDFKYGDELTLDQHRQLEGVVLHLQRSPWCSVDRGTLHRADVIHSCATTPVPSALSDEANSTRRTQRDGKPEGHQEEFFPLRFSCGSRQEKGWFE